MGDEDRLQEVTPGSPRFAVIYRWRLRPGTEAAFRDAWAEVTAAIRRDRGGLGSRLHRADDGSWLAYAQWPDRASWETAQSLPSADAIASSAMTRCIMERLPPILLETVADLLVGQT
jgi:quinol monooxygenase YgiN